jgi:tetraprenyl-beta-curcumene synthase
MSNAPTPTLPTAATFIEDPRLHPCATHQPLLPRGLAARGAVALLTANARYWPSVAPRVRMQLAHWQREAGAIPDPTLRDLALNKLTDERFNVEVAATLATLAPAAHRTRVTDAIVALEVLYEYIDVLSERRDRDPDRLFAPLQAAFEVRAPESDADDVAHVDTDSRYVNALADTIRSTLTYLPNGGTVAQVCRRIAARCAEAQTHYHALGDSGIEAARRWAALQPEHTDLGWQELLAGSCASVLAIHAVIAAAADHATTAKDADDLAELYLLIGALAMLDSLVDHDEDIATGRPGYLHYYGDSQLMGGRLVHVARAAAQHACQLPNGPHHIVTLVGVVAYYASAPSASEEPAGAIVDCVCRELRPLITPTLALMRVWRLAKRIRRFAHQAPLPSVTADDDGGPR